MPRFRPKGMLERNPSADLWKNTLSKIPTLCGRLVYLTELRDPNSGAYRHYGLTQAFGREESGRTLKESHEQVFAGWLKLSLANKSEDLEAHLASLEEESPVVATNWIRTNYAAALIPERTTRAQRSHFLQELGTLLELIRNRSGSHDVGLPNSGRRA